MDLKSVDLHANQIKELYINYYIYYMFLTKYLF